MQKRPRLKVIGSPFLWQGLMGFFLVERPLVQGERFELAGEEALHLLGSRRIRIGEEVEVQDPQGHRFLATVLSKERKSLELLNTKELVPPAEPKFRLWLHQAMVKEKALDWILQKSVELGAAGVFLFETEHSQPLPQGEERTHRLERWHKILWEACKQSGRHRPPVLTLSAVSPLGQAFDQPAFVFDPYRPPTFLKNLTLESQGAHLILGPEAGFEPEELSGFSGHYLGLGPRILRAETAALSLLAILHHEFGG